MLQAELKILGGKHQGKAIPLSTRKFLVGREQDCQLRPNSDLVSRHHCVFTIDDYAVRLRDLGSTNGTRVNGKPLHGEVTLKDGDQIGIGKLDLELVVRQRVEVAVAPSAAPIAEIPLPPLPEVEHLSAASASGTVEISSMLSGMVPIESETSFELPTVVAPTGETSTNLTSDTAIVPGSAPGYPAQYPNYPQMPMAGYPAAGPPGYPAAPGYGAPVAQGYGAAPGYPAPPGYPGQPMGYQQPMGYPGQYPGYPQQAYPQQGYAQQGYPAMPGYQNPMQMPYGGGYPAAPAAAPAPAEAAEIGVKLPPPDQTGVKAPPPPDPAAVAAAAAAGAAPAKTDEKPSNTAADIIKSYMQKRNR